MKDKYDVLNDAIEEFIQDASLSS